MKILIVDQYYYPEEFQINDISWQLVKDGHQVTVLTGLPNYPSGNIPEEYRHGRRRDEYMNGVHVIRCFEIARKPGAAGMSLNYLSYCISAVLKGYLLHGQFDVVFIYETSPVLMAYPAEVFARRKRIPVFLYCCDIWPEVVKVMLPDENSMAFRIIKKLSTCLYKRADLIAVQSKGFYQYFDTVHGISGEKLRYLPQYADSDYAEQDFTPEDNGIVDFVFLGNIGMAQDICGLIQAVEQIRELPGFKVHLVGEGSYLNEAKKLVGQKKLERQICFYGRRPYEEMPQFYKIADVCLATLQADSAISLTIPSKVQGYMAAGKPIIAALSGFARDVVEESRSGICVTPGNIDELAAAMKAFIEDREKYKDCGINARSYYAKHFTKEHFMESLYSLLDETITFKK